MSSLDIADLDFNYSTHQTERGKTPYKFDRDVIRARPAYNEGFLGGNVEVMLLEGELVVVFYHFSLPDTYPVTISIGAKTRFPDGGVNNFV